MREYVETPVVRPDYGADVHGAWHRRVPKRDKTISARQWRILKKNLRETARKQNDSA